MIAAIVLSAGESRRMGSPKALLPFPKNREQTFLEHLVTVFAAAECDPIIVVVGHQGEAIVAESKARGLAFEHVRFVHNQHYRDGMLSSIRTGIQALPEDARAFLLCPVDHPDVSTVVIERVVREFERTDAPIVLPVNQGRRGHPVLFSRRVFGELMRAPDSVGARQVVWDHQKDLLEIQVDDSGVTTDIDTPADLERFERGARSE